MTQFLPPNLLSMFTPRPALPFAEPLDRDPRARRGPTIGGIAQYLAEFTDSKDNPPPPPAETREQRKKRIAALNLEKHQEEIQSKLAQWDPHKDPNVTEDPYKTIIVGRLSYDVTERRLKREFEQYGPIKKVRMVVDSETGKPKGYAFIEFEKEKDVKAAYKEADGKKIDNRRCVVDVERGRTVSGWRPRRLGGGKGKTRAGGPEENQKHSGREDLPTDGSRRERSRSRSPRRSRETGGSHPGSGGRERDRDRDRERDRDSHRDSGRDHRERDYSHRERNGGSGGGDRRDRDHRGGGDRYGGRDDRGGGGGGDRYRGGDRDRGRTGGAERERDRR